MNLCDDNRIITIEKAKQALIKGTNIEDSPEEMKVLDNILFRCWQMGWLDRYDPQKKQPITEEKIKAWLDRWEGYIDADMIARMKCRVIDIRNVHHSQAATDINVGHKAAGHGSNVPMQQTIPPMPSNTSNALKALDDVNVTQSNALDCISRKAAIELCDWYDNPSMREDLEKLRPARFSADTISRQAAIDLIESIETERLKGNIELIYAPAIKGLRALPPAQPESDSGRWERHYSRPGVYADLCWHCSKCGYKTDYQYANVNHRYCPNCGRKMERKVSDE